MKLSHLLLEGVTVFECQILIKTEYSYNLVQIYNLIRALKGVVVVSVEQNDYLTNRSSKQHVYSLLYLKYISTKDPVTDVKKIRLDAFTTNKIHGLLQFVPRFTTIKKVSSY